MFFYICFVYVCLGIFLVWSDFYLKWNSIIFLNLSLQLKHSLNALHFCISSQPSLLVVFTGERQFSEVMAVDRWFNSGCHVNLFVLVICSTLILARLMASFNVLSLNVRFHQWSRISILPWICRQKLFVSNGELDCLIFQTLFDNLEGI